MNVFSNLTKSLAKRSKIPQIVVPEFLENMMAPLQNVTEYNQHEIDICKGNLLMRVREWKKVNHDGEPSKEIMDGFYRDIQQSGEFELYVKIVQ